MFLYNTTDFDNFSQSMLNYQSSILLFGTLLLSSFIASFLLFYYYLSID